MATINSTNFSGDTLEIIAFRLHDQEFCVKTTTIREIRGWAPSTPIPHAPKDVVGVMNLRGTVIPIIDLAYKLGMQSTAANERSAIVVTEVRNMIIGMLVDRVTANDALVTRLLSDRELHEFFSSAFLEALYHQIHADASIASVSP